MRPRTPRPVLANDGTTARQRLTTRSLTLDTAVPGEWFPDHPPWPYKAKGTTQRHTTMKCRAVAETVMMWNTS